MKTSKMLVYERCCKLIEKMWLELIQKQLTCIVRICCLMRWGNPWENLLWRDPALFVQQRLSCYGRVLTYKQGTMYYYDNLKKTLEKCLQKDRKTLLIKFINRVFQR